MNLSRKKQFREKTTAGTARGTVKRSAELILQLVRTMQGLNTVINNEYDLTEFSIFSNEDILSYILHHTGITMIEPYLLFEDCS